MDRDRRGSFIHSLLTFAGLVLGFQYGGTVGALYFAPGPLAWLTGFFVIGLGCAALGKFLAARRPRRPGTSTVGLLIGGLPWRLVARLAWVGVLAAPVAAAVWAWRSGLIERFLTEVLR